jgi:EmrB/QacA subfamily drug resistance transporter
VYDVAVRRHAGPNVTITVLGIAGIAYALLGSAVVPALPVMQRDLHVSENALGWVFTGYLLSASVATAIIGRLGDMYGKKRMLVWTLGLFAVGTLIAALSHSLGILIVGRVMQGVAGGIFPLAFGLIADTFPRERVPGSIGFVSGVMAMGSAAGVVVGALIVEHLSWQWIFWMGLVLVVISTIGAWLFVQESPIRVGGRINWLSAALMSLGITMVLLGLTETTSWGWGSPKTIALIGGGVAVCGAWVIVEMRSRAPLIDMAMMRIRGVWTTNLVAFLLGVGMYTAFVVFPQFAQLPKSTGFGFGASPLMSGIYLLPFMAGTVSMSFCAGIVARRYGPRLGVIVGSAIATVAFAITTFAHANPGQMVLTTLLIGVGVGLAYAPLGNLIVRSVRPDQTGAATGMNSVMRTIGGAIGAQLSATFIADHVHAGYPTVTGFTETFAMATIFLVICTFCAFLIPKGVRTRVIAEAQPEPEREAVLA